ncbi:MAG: hypothetical protein ACR2N6_02895, partial [Miltoncostaeaceae bacterium]
LYNVQVFEWRGSKWVKVRSLFPRRAGVRISRALRPGRRHAWQVWPWVGRGYKRSAVRVSYFDTPARRASRLLSPRAARVAAGRRLVLRWKAAPGARLYTVRVGGAARMGLTTRRTVAVLPARIIRRGRLTVEVLRGRGASATPWVTRRLSVR